MDKINQNIQMSNQICRTCMNLSSKVTSLFDFVQIRSQKLQLKFVLLKCISLEVMENEKFYHNICDTCVKLLKSFYIFREECFKAHVKFEKLCQSAAYICDKEELHQINKHANIKISSYVNNVFIDVKVPTEVVEFNEDVTDDECVLDESVKSDVESNSEQNKVEHSVNDQNEIKKAKKTLIFSCEQCKKIFRSKYGLNEHVKIHLEIEKTKCEICKKQFTRIADVKRHMVIHTGIKPYTCTICDKSFTQSGSLSAHMKKHEDFKGKEKNLKNSVEKTHLCSICGKIFNKAFSLTVHTRRHIEEKPYKCNTCDMRFVTSGRLTSHKRSHTGERPFKCKYCGKSYAHCTVLSTHLKSHLPVKPHQCSHCTMKFSSLHELTIHNRKHTGEKPFKCTMCAKTFSYAKNLKQHTKTHTEEKSHVCVICGKSFRRSQHLKNHINIHTKRN